MADRHSIALGDELRVELRVVPEIAPVRPEFLLRRNREAGEARRLRLVLPESPVQLRDEVEVVRRPGPDLYACVDGLHHRGLARGPDELNTEREPEPGIGERLVARRDQRQMAGRAGRDPASGERGIQITYGLGLARLGSAAREVDDRADVAEAGIGLEPADQIGDDVVAADRDDAGGAIVLEISL